MASTETGGRVDSGERLWGRGLGSDVGGNTSRLSRRDSGVTKRKETPVGMKSFKVRSP